MWTSCSYVTYSPAATFTIAHHAGKITHVLYKNVLKSQTTVRMDASKLKPERWFQTNATISTPASSDDIIIAGLKLGRSC